MAKKILLLGAGLSTKSLIRYLLSNSDKYDWKLRIGDINLENILQKTENHPNSEAFVFDINDNKQLYDEVSKADIVVSMMPARFHHLVARACIDNNKNMVTASYVSPEIKVMEQEAKEKGLLILMEMGVDPGIDHMSAMEVINRLKKGNYKITLFKSFTGGLVAPKYDNNPWNYKFTWNPRNVVLAGQGTSMFIRNGKYKYIPYCQVFRRTERVFVDEVGEFEAYANRDSLKYREIYGLEDIPTIFRGTLRRPGFCKGWDIFVQLGMTDDTYFMEGLENMTYREFTNSFLPYSGTLCVEEKIRKMFRLSEDSLTLYKLRWLGLFSNEKIGLTKATPAQVLQHLLMEKWELDEGDKDMIVMQHQFEFEKNGKREQIHSSMVVYGTDEDTAMSFTVGTPVAIGTKLILTGEIKETGVKIPVIESIYKPVLKELKEYGIKFTEKFIPHEEITEPFSKL
jgi:saccharopine dehydrogenase-like NADP-dependent oxidoreductase